MSSAMKDEILEYTQRVYKTEGVPPPIRRITAQFKISNDALYLLFPGGIGEICTLAGVPSREDHIGKNGTSGSRTESIPVKSTSVPLEVPRKSEGEIASEVFSLRRQGSNLSDLVIQLRISPDLAKIYSDKYDEFVGNMILSAAERREINSILPLGSSFYDLKSLKSCFQKILEERQDYKSSAESAEAELGRLTNYFSFSCPVCGDPMYLTEEIWNRLKTGGSLLKWTHIECDPRTRYEIIYS